MGTGIVSYFITEIPIKDNLYNPYTSAISVHDNIYESKKQMPTLKHDMGVLFFLKFGRNVPDIIYDGMLDPQYVNSDGTIDSERRLCIQNNTGAEFLNLEIDKNFKKWYSPFLTDFSTDITPFFCGGHQLNHKLTNN